MVALWAASRNVGDLARKQGIQEIVLHKKEAFSRTAKSLARVDLPAAIFPQKNINFAEFF
jgi:hypothetical protein